MAFSEPVHKTDLSAGVCILAPVADPYRAAAGRLKAALEGTVSAGVDVLPDGGAQIGGRHVVALGNMMDSAFLRALYFRAVPAPCASGALGGSLSETGAGAAAQGR